MAQRVETVVEAAWLWGCPEETAAHWITEWLEDPPWSEIRPEPVEARGLDEWWQWMCAHLGGSLQDADTTPSEPYIGEPVQQTWSDGAKDVDIEQSTSEETYGSVETWVRAHPELLDNPNEMVAILRTLSTDQGEAAVAVWAALCGLLWGTHATASTNQVAGIFRALLQQDAHLGDMILTIGAQEKPEALGMFLSGLDLDPAGMLVVAEWVYVNMQADERIRRGVGVALAATDAHTVVRLLAALAGDQTIARAIDEMYATNATTTIEVVSSLARANIYFAVRWVMGAMTSETGISKRALTVLQQLDTQLAKSIVADLTTRVPLAGVLLKQELRKVSPRTAERIFGMQ